MNNNLIALVDFCKINQQKQKKHEGQTKMDKKHFVLFFLCASVGSLVAGFLIGYFYTDSLIVGKINADMDELNLTFCQKTEITKNNPYPVS